MNAVSHGTKDLCNVVRFLLKDGVLGEGTKFVIHSLCPVANLVIDNVNAFKPLSQGRIVLHYLGELSLHFDNLVICMDTSCMIASINLELVEARGKHVVISLKFIDSLVCFRYIGQELGVVDLALKEL